MQPKAGCAHRFLVCVVAAQWEDVTVGQALAAAVGLSPWASPSGSSAASLHGSGLALSALTAELGSHHGACGHLLPGCVDVFVDSVDRLLVVSLVDCVLALFGALVGCWSTASGLLLIPRPTTIDGTNHNSTSLAQDKTCTHLAEISCAFCSPCRSCSFVCIVSCRVSHTDPLLRLAFLPQPLPQQLIGLHSQLTCISHTDLLRHFPFLPPAALRSVPSDGQVHGGHLLKGSARVHLCTKDDPLRTVVERLAIPGVRRLVAVHPETRRVEGIISLSDVASYLFV